MDKNRQTDFDFGDTVWRKKQNLPPSVATVTIQTPITSCLNSCSRLLTHLPALSLPPMVTVIMLKLNSDQVTLCPDPANASLLRRGSSLCRGLGDPTGSSPRSPNPFHSPHSAPAMVSSLSSSNILSLPQSLHQSDPLPGMLFYHGCPDYLPWALLKGPLSIRSPLARPPVPYSPTLLYLHHSP